MLKVTSEVGRLRRVLVHEPGPEVDHMVPAMMEQLLFDDILYGDGARSEHGRFRRVLQLLGAEPVETLDLLRETLEQPEAREWVYGVLPGNLPDSLRERMEQSDAAGLAEMLVGGVRSSASRTAVEAEELYDLTPLPNWCFQRDPQVVLGSGVIFCAMGAAARQREALLSRAIFRFHPELRGAVQWFDPLEGGAGRSVLAESNKLCIEGGDLLVASPSILIVGISERTNRAAVDKLCRALARQDQAPRWVLAVEIPRRRAYMHLDTLFTFIDRDLCLAFPPVMQSSGPQAARAFAIDLESRELEWSACGDMFSALRERGLDIEAIPCGGPDAVTQQREQWTDGANALAVAPGVLTLYDRNVATLEELSSRGFRVVSADDLLLGEAEVDLDVDRRVCISLASNELSRARGGPHCLTHPLLRDDLS
ncbi:hypothetical protein ABI59_02520 [Acidobacteria bacterium Mor1]|nr:hypothetical protein ABI59_02520 [Acidobacteria bacterium Mor1]